MGTASELEFIDSEYRAICDRHAPSGERLHRLIGGSRGMFVGIIALLVVGIVPAKGEGAPKVEWPDVRAGIWEIRSVRTLPNGKTQALTEELSACSDTSYIFRGYWGLGIVEAGGCEYASDRLSRTELRIASKCTVRGSGVARSTMVIAVKDEDTFSLRVDVREGRRRYHGEEDACWIRSCPQR